MWGKDQVSIEMHVIVVIKWISELQVVEMI